MENVLAQLADAARQERAVASRKLTNGLQLLVYPLDSGALVALGLDRDVMHSMQPEIALRKRTDNLARYGPWQPALFNDGSLYMVRRVDDISSGAFILSEDDILAAEELLT